MNKHNAMIMVAVGAAVGMVLAPRVGASAEDEILEQIIVTTQKRATALQDVPFSVAAASEASVPDKWCATNPVTG